MPVPEKLTKARIQEIYWDKNQQQSHTTEKKPVEVQFNPETLKISFSNQSAGEGQTGGAAIQFVGQGTTKLSFDLWFDVTAPQPGNQSVDDVRKLTKEIAYFMQPKPSDKPGKFVPPGARFLWGTFLFEGIVESLNETLEFFSENGKPLRARVSVSMTKQDIQYLFEKEPAAGTTRQEPAQQGESLATLMARTGQPPEQAQKVALAHGIENLRSLPPGTPIDTRVR